jgi:hypothetical protein
MGGTEGIEAMMDIDKAFQAAYEASAEKRYVDAERQYRMLLAHDPDQHGAARMFAAMLGGLGRFGEAIETLSYVLACEPNHAASQHMMGLFRQNLGEMDRAGYHYARALEIAPTFANAHWDRALWCLMHGDRRPRLFEDGWREYEWGVVGGQRPMRHLQPAWDGRPIPGKRLYVWAEQGLGDTLQFVRLLGMARERSRARIVLEIQEALACLLHDYPDADEVVIQSADRSFATPFDEHVSLLSLPHVLGLGVEDIPKGAYLKAPSREIRGSDGRLKVGLCWSGNPGHANDKHRSLSADALAPLLSVKDVWFFSLQKDQEAPQGMASIALRNMADTAGLIAQMDMVVTVDTAVAHLAGGMGKPVWILLPKNNDFRWFLERPDSPWYPSARLWRQETLGEWGAVIERVRGELEAVAARKAERYELAPAGVGEGI